MSKDCTSTTTDQQEDEQAPQQKPADLHVVTENGEQCFMWRANQLSYIAQDRDELPVVLANKFGPLATKLDLSYNSLTTFENINLFTNLSELILDNNNLDDDHLDFKQNLRLKTLSLNKNKLLDLHRLVNSIKVCFPNLEFLSLIGNPLCPTLSSSDFTNTQLSGANANHQIEHSDGSCSSTSMVADGRHLFDLCNRGSPLEGKQTTEFSNKRYRYFIIYHLPNLRFLDSSPIGSLERDEALRRFYWMVSPPTSQGLVCDHNSQCATHNNGIENNGLSTTQPSGTNHQTVVPQSNSPTEDGFQLTIMTNYSIEEAANNNAQPSRGQSSVISNSRYALRLGFSVKRAI